MVAVACVPATDEETPAGAVGILVRPSFATLGESFLTSDGWTVTVENVAVFAQFLAWHANDDNGSGFAQASSLGLFHGREIVQGVVRAIPAGPTLAQVQLAYRYRVDEDLHCRRYHFCPETFASADLVPRFTQPADSSEVHACNFDNPDGTTDNSDCGDPPLPSIWITARGVKNGKTVRFDFTLESDSSGPVSENALAGATATVTADSLVRVTATLAVEEFFTNYERRVVFGDLAAADTNGDGVVTIEELRAQKGVERSRDAGADAGDAGEDAFAFTDDDTLLAVVRRRASGVFVYP